MGKGLAARGARLVGRGLGYLTGLLAFGLVVARLGRLLLTGVGFGDWQIVLVASALLGGVTWWLVVRLLSSQYLGLAAFLASAMALFLRVAVPGTLIAGVVPGPQTGKSLVLEMSKAVDVVRHGVPPVEAVDGLVAILALLTFLIGASVAWGAAGGGPMSAVVVPPFVLYLQLGVFDTEPAGAAWMLASATVLSLGTAAIALERREDMGGTRDDAGRPLPRRSAPTALATSAAAAIVALLIANVGSVLAPERGLAAGGGDFIRGLFGNQAQSFDRWVDLRQRLLSPTGAVMFTARLDDPRPTSQPLYWRMETLDQFNGIAWTRSDLAREPYIPGTAISDLASSYAGTIVPVVQEVEVANLRTGAGIVPVAGWALELNAPRAGQGGLQPSDFEILPDGAVAHASGLGPGSSYRLLSEFPDVEADLGALATGPAGGLTPLFAAAAASGAWDFPPLTLSGVSTPPDLGRYQALPPDVPASLQQLALEITAGATTDFERAWMLQSFFRDSGSFTYSTQVSTGHRSLDLANWLGDPTSQNYRTGYCEQFAASMAVLARTLGMGSRVIWGFAPAPVENGVIVVRDLNAHAWVEVWIEGFGWVPFEPTPRSDILPRSLTSQFDTAAIAAELRPTSAPPPPPPVPEPPQTPAGSGSSLPIAPLWIALTGAVALISLVPLLKAARRARRMRRLSDGEVAAAWDEIVDQLKDLGASISPAWTPLELADRMNPGLTGVATRYSAEIYGYEAGLGQPSDLVEAQEYLRDAFPATKRVMGRLNPRSLIKSR